MTTSLPNVPKTKRKYFVTIDREEWKAARSWQFWTKAWHIERSRKVDQIKGIGRTVFEIDRDTSVVRPLFQLDQLLDSEVLKGSWKEQSTWTKSFTRGLRAITLLDDGGFVINDIFGVYLIDQSGIVNRYVTRSDISDMHCALPNASNDRLLLTSTGTEEILEVDWLGNVQLRFSIPELFGLPNSAQVNKAKADNPDHRTMRLDHNRELFHVNWAQWVIEGKQMYISLHCPGIVALVDIDDDGRPTIGKKWSYFPHCHGPAFDFESKSLLVAASKVNQVRELSLSTGEIRWANNGLSYSKRIRPVNCDIAIACDCNGRRIVEIDRNSGKELWSCDLPGLPYDVAFLTEKNL